MKKILLVLTLIFLSTNISNSAENSCQGIKKLSKDYIACKAGNLKKVLTNKSENSSNTLDTSSNTKKVSEGAKNVGKKIKKAGSGIGKFLSGFGPKKKD